MDWPRPRWTTGTGRQRFPEGRQYFLSGSGAGWTMICADCEEMIAWLFSTTFSLAAIG